MRQPLIRKLEAAHRLHHLLLCHLPLHHHLLHPLLRRSSLWRFLTFFLFLWCLLLLRVEIKRAAKPAAEENANAAGGGDNLKSKLLDEITKGVTLRKVAPKPKPPLNSTPSSNLLLRPLNKPTPPSSGGGNAAAGGGNNPASGEEPASLFALGAMASMMAKKRMARMSVRIEAENPLKGPLDSLLNNLPK